MNAQYGNQNICRAVEHSSERICLVLDAAVILVVSVCVVVLRIMTQLL